MPLAAGLVPTKLLALEEAALAPAWGLHHSTVQSLQSLQMSKLHSFQNEWKYKVERYGCEEAKSKAGTLVCHHAQQCQLSRPWET